MCNCKELEMDRLADITGLSSNVIVEILDCLVKEVGMLVKQGKHVAMDIKLPNNMFLVAHPLGFNFKSKGDLSMLLESYNPQGTPPPKSKTKLGWQLEGPKGIIVPTFKKRTLSIATSPKGTGEYLSKGKLKDFDGGASEIGAGDIRSKTTKHS